MNEKGFATISILYLSIILIFIAYFIVSISSIIYNQNLTQNAADQVSIKLALTKDCKSLNNILNLNKVVLEKCESRENEVEVKVKKILDLRIYENLSKLGINLSELTARSNAF
jgi:vacuolar-type H+-ATPase catalytic subunit A/Vma1